MDRYEIKLTLTEPMLGTVPLNAEVYRDWVIKHHGLDPELLSDEVESVETASELIDEKLRKDTTGFHRLADGTPFIYDHMIKGFLKAACGSLRRDSDSRSSKLRAYIKVIEGQVFPIQRRIVVQKHWDAKAMALYELDPGWTTVEDEGIYVRALRASTPQGDRVALARSIAMPAGSELEFGLRVLGTVTQPLLEEWLIYGGFRGLGQWRNGSFGRFDYELAKQ